MIPKGTISPAWWGLAFVSYALASLTWAASINWWALGWLSLLTLAFTIGLLVQSLWGLWLVLFTGLLLNVAAAIMQYFDLGFTQYVIHYPAGFFGNSNYFACAIALIMVIALCERIFWLLPIGAVGLWLASSRTAIIGFSVAFVVWLWPRSRWVVAIFVPLTIVILIDASSYRIDTLAARLGVWQDTINHLTLFGSGWGTFQEAYAAFPVRTNMTEFRAAHAYSDFLELVFELGIGTIFLWVLLGAVLERALEPERLVLICFFVMSLSYFPLYIFTGPIAALAAGRALAPERKPYGSLAAYKSTLPEHR